MGIDHTLLFYLNSFAGQSPAQDGLIIFCATYLPFLVVAGFGAWVFFTPSKLSLTTKWIHLLVAISTGLFARLFVVEPIRYFFPRLRPIFAEHVHGLFTIAESSFPSGHATFFFAFSTVVFWYHRRLGILFYFLTLVICAARVAAGVHYPSDILGGAIVGSISGVLICKFLVPYLKKNLKA
jgi:undecaprenyl-diphosphatase